MLRANTMSRPPRTLQGERPYDERRSAASVPEPLTMSSVAQPIALEYRQVSKSYKHSLVLDNINLSVCRNELITVLGPSGSGKSTLLMIAAGFQEASAGTVYADGQLISGVPAEKRDFGVVFQSYALFPHMSVLGNVEFALRMRRVSASERRRRACEALEMVGLGGYEHRRPGQLSGGEQQRVALARALVFKPRLLLLDEPLAALDRTMRQRMQVEIKRLRADTDGTFLMVTHDQEEALTISDRVVVMSRGRVEQVGPPTELYGRPQTAFVAGFLGRANLLPAEIDAPVSGRARFRTVGGLTGEVPCSASCTAAGPAQVLVRPMDLTATPWTDRAVAGDQELSFVGTLRMTTFVGSAWRYQIEGAGMLWDVEQQRELPVGDSGKVVVSWPRCKSWLIR